MDRLLSLVALYCRSSDSQHNPRLRIGAGHSIVTNQLRLALELRVSREPDGHRLRRSPGWSGLDPRHSSCLWFQMLGVEAHSSLPHDQNDRGNLSCQSQSRHFLPHALSPQLRILFRRVRILMGVLLSPCPMARSSLGTPQKEICTSPLQTWVKAAELRKPPVVPPQRRILAFLPD